MFYLLYEYIIEMGRVGDMVTGIGKDMKINTIPHADDSTVLVESKK